MQDVASDVSRLLVRELEACRREVELFSDEDRLWQTTRGVTNSAGNLVLHVCGNLQYFLGTVLGRTGYVRNREAEFGRRSGTRRELTAEIETTIATVRATLAALSPEALDAPFPEPILGLTPRTGLVIMHLASHTAFHLGQIGYLRRIVTEDTRSSGALPIPALAD